MNAQKVGQKICQLRKTKGLTQAELADMLHVTDGAVSKWERGINFPDLAMIEPIASALDTTVTELLSLEEISKQEIVSTISTISLEEKRQLIRDLKLSSRFKIFIELLLIVSLITASKIFDNHQIYGLAMVTTLGMLSFIGTLIGYELRLMASLNKLH